MVFLDVVMACAFLAGHGLSCNIDAPRIGDDRTLIAFTDAADCQRVGAIVSGMYTAERYYVISELQSVSVSCSPLPEKSDAIIISSAASR